MREALQRLAAATRPGESAPVSLLGSPPETGSWYLEATGLSCSTAGPTQVLFSFVTTAPL
jgi:hypothetical protein